MAACVVYKAQLGERLYFGCTGLQLSERCENMRHRPVFWLQGQAGPLRMEPMFSRRVDLPTGLALEAAFTALAWAQEPARVRGGPWCLARLPSQLVGELQQVADSLAGKASLQAKADAVWEVAKAMPRRGAL